MYPSTGKLLLATAALTSHVAGYAQSPAPRVLTSDGGVAFPAKPIRLVVPFPPGASTDTIGRVLAQRLTDLFGQQVLVDNRGGAGGNIGAEVVARANPDGYTLLLGSAGLLTMNPSLYPDMRVDPQRDLAPIGPVARVANVLVVQPGVPVTTLAQLVHWARARPGELNYGSAGNGSSVHLGAELFKLMTGTQIVHVPYRGGAPAMNDLLGGHIQMMFNSVPLALPYIQAGRIRPLAVTSRQRVASLPDVPTMQQAGLDGFEFTGWFGLLCAGASPRRLTDWLAAELSALLGAQDMRNRLSALGAEAAPGTSAELAALIRTETRRWAEVIRQTGIRVD